ncbi:MAG TPA: dihydrodipicolinate synthase family protein [Acidimicrobiales bacterium]|jgi:4-hydroxy-tetrahydrodipicolinate synthase|nr:dihydrodipicolinate synthase family protein [Acidimicrobiales bacterium]
MNELNTFENRLARSEVSGVLPVFQTPFDDRGDIDFEALRREINWLLDEDADGVVFAMVSEILRLSSYERDAVAAAACEYVGERGATVISVGAESTKVALAHARHAQAVGASAVMAAAPALHRADDEELFSYFTAIAEHVDVPIIVQDASGYVGASLSVDLQARLHRELGDRCLFKPEATPIGPRLSELMDATDGQALVFEGTGGLYLIDSFRRGVVGTMPAADLVWALVALWDALVGADYDRAYEIAGPLALMVSMQTSLDSFVAIEKHLLVDQGVISSAAMRGPVGHGLDDTTLAECERLMALLQDVVASDSETDDESL